jgi:hypothetical protein
VFLQILQELAHGGSRQIQGICRLGKGAGIRDADKDAKSEQLVHRRVALGHR